MMAGARESFDASRALLLLRFCSSVVHQSSLAARTGWTADGALISYSSVSSCCPRSCCTAASDSRFLHLLGSVCRAL